jgi:hypothetical protein
MALRRWSSALAMALAAGCAASTATPVPESGPFAQPPPYGFATGVAVRTVFTDGMTVLQNVSGKPVRLIRIRFDPGERGLELVGEMVAGTGRAAGSYQSLPSFPPASTPPSVVLGPLSEVRGHVVGAGEQYATHGVELLLGVRKAAPGRATRRALLVDYEVDGVRATQGIPSTLAVCELARKSTCPQEYGDERAS